LQPVEVVHILVVHNLQLHHLVSKFSGDTMCLLGERFTDHRLSSSTVSVASP